MTTAISAPDLLAQTLDMLGADHFSDALRRWLDRCCGIDNFAVIAFFSGKGPQVLATHATDARVFARVDSDYVQGAYLLDPFHGLHQAEAPEGVYRLSDIAPDQFQRNEYYKSYYARTTLTDELAFLARPASGVSITVCIGRDATTGARFSARACTQARQIAPVVNALVRRNWSDLGAITSPPPDVPAALRQRLARDRDILLSARQSQVALLILQGHSSVSIGLTLGISPQTVKVLRKQLYKKCHISSQGELYYLIAPFLDLIRAA